VKSAIDHESVVERVISEGTICEATSGEGTIKGNQVSKCWWLDSGSCSGVGGCCSSVVCRKVILVVGVVTGDAIW